MKIQEFSVRNYKGLRELKVGFSDYTTLIGENGSGKTSLLEALYLLFKDFSIIGGAPSKMLQEITAWHQRNLPVELTAKIVFDEGEYGDIFPEEVSGKIIEKYGDRHSELTICRRIPKPGAPWETAYIDIAKAHLVKDNAVVSPEELTKAVSKVAPKRPTGKLKAVLFDPNASQSKPVGNRLVILNNKAYHMDGYTDTLVREGKIPIEQLPGVDYKEWATNQRLELVENPPAKEDINALLTGEPPLITAAILQNAQNKIVEKIKGKLKLIPATRDERVEAGERRSFLGEPTIINPLRALHGTDDEAWHEMRTTIEQLIGQELDSVPKLSTWENGLHLDVSLIGGGQQEIIGLIYQIYKASESIIAIEEPEAHLHHNLARKLFEILKEAANKKQLIIATHCEHFAEISETSRNWFLEKKVKAKETKPKEIKTKEELVEAFGLLGAEPSDRGYPNKMLFVGGETEEGVLPVWARTLNLNIKKVRIEPLEGEHDWRKIKIINGYVKDAQTAVFLMVDSHANEKVKQAVGEDHRLIIKGTTEDYYPIPILIQVLNDKFDLDLTKDDIEPQKPRIEEIKKVLKEKCGIPFKNTFWKRSLGKEVAQQMAIDQIPENVQSFLKRILD